MDWISFIFFISSPIGQTEAVDMNGRFQMQGGKNWILPKYSRSMQTGSSGTLIGWKSGQTTFVPLWDGMEGAWLRTLHGEGIGLGNRNKQ
jgi:hypothetical protein